jgi:hypothetical protein
MIWTIITIFTAFFKKSINQFLKNYFSRRLKQNKMQRDGIVLVEKG